MWKPGLRGLTEMLRFGVYLDGLIDSLIRRACRPFFTPLSFTAAAQQIIM